MDLIKRLKVTAIGKVPFYLLSTILLMRFLAVFLMGPIPQDAYYFFYSQHPALSYFDHPPAIAYLLLIFTSVLGKNVLAIKLADSFLTILTCLAVYRLAIRFFPRFEAEKIIVLFLTTLMVIILSLVSTHDRRLLFFWTVSLKWAHQVIFFKFQALEKTFITPGQTTVLLQTLTLNLYKKPTQQKGTK